GQSTALSFGRCSELVVEAVNTRRTEVSLQRITAARDKKELPSEANQERESAHKKTRASLLVYLTCMLLHLHVHLKKYVRSFAKKIFCVELIYLCARMYAFLRSSFVWFGLVFLSFPFLSFSWFGTPWLDCFFCVGREKGWTPATFGVEFICCSFRTAAT
ncbi:unnamed protein product, partial [Ectocarpus sp. 8 AP-2014]